jgi:hypothetical protein
MKMKSFVIVGLSMICIEMQAQQFSKVLTGPLVNTAADSRSVNWIDVNNDGFLDCMITNGPSGGQNNSLFINTGAGNFTALSGDSIVLDGKPSDGASWGDTDNDGDMDAFVTNWYNVNNLFYSNNGSGTFTRINGGIHVNDAGYSETAAWGDYDNDGLLDLYVTNSAGIKRNFLYHNLGANTFTKITTGSVVTDIFTSRSVNWTDIDNDNDVDLFVTNEIGQHENIYRNDGAGVFTKLTSGPLLNNGGNTMSGSWGDIDNDGDLDVFLANEQSANALFINNGSFNFTKVTNDTLVKGISNAFSSAWSDIDNDGDLDIFVTYAFTGTTKQVNRLYLNNGSGNFSRVTDAPSQDSCWAYGCAFGDYDNDGFEDLAVATCRFGGVDQPDLLYHNNGNSNKWITLQLIGTISNRSAIGAKVRLKANIGGVDVWQYREISAQSSYCGQNDMRAHFGLASAGIIDSLVIQWPSGIVQFSTGISPNQFITIPESGILSVNEIQDEIQDLVLYPNPVHDLIHLKSGHPTIIQSWEIISPDGRCILQHRSSDPTINVGTLKEGIYLLRIHTTDGVVIKRFTKTP